MPRTGVPATAGAVALIAAVRAGLERRADPRKAAPMQVYAKSAMPYYGVQAPGLRAACAGAFRAHSLPTAATWRRAIAALWDTAGRKEQRYAAIELAAHRPCQRFVSLSLLPLYRRMIREGAWWDTVDAIAHRVAVLLQMFPVPMKRTLRLWARQDNLWLRRTAIIAQVHARETTDRRLLYDCIRPSLSSREFFLQKAIGWALREFAKAEPGEVRRYLDCHAGQLSTLARREAAKGLAIAARRGPLRQSRRRR